MFYMSILALMLCYRELNKTLKFKTKTL